MPSISSVKIKFVDRSVSGLIAHMISWCRSFFSREPRLYKRVCPSVGPSVGPSVRRSVRNAFVPAGRDEPANDLFRVYELVSPFSTVFLFGSKNKT